MKAAYFTLFVCGAVICNVVADIRDFIIQSEEDLQSWTPTSDEYTENGGCYADDLSMEDVLPYGSDEYGTDDMEWTFKFATEATQNRILNGEMLNEIMRNIMKDPRFREQYSTWKSVAQSLAGNNNNNNEMEACSSCQTPDMDSVPEFYTDLADNNLYDSC